MARGVNIVHAKLPVDFLSREPVCLSSPLLWGPFLHLPNRRLDLLALELKAWHLQQAGYSCQREFLKCQLLSCLSSSEMREMCSGC